MARFEAEQKPMKSSGKPIPGNKKLESKITVKSFDKHAAPMAHEIARKATSAEKSVALRSVVTSKRQRSTCALLVRPKRKLAGTSEAHSSGNKKHEDRSRRARTKEIQRLRNRAETTEDSNERNQARPGLVQLATQ